MWPFPGNHFAHPLVSRKNLASISWSDFSNPHFYLARYWPGLWWIKSQLYFVLLLLLKFLKLSSFSSFYFLVSFCICSSKDSCVYNISFVLILFVTVCPMASLALISTECNSVLSSLWFSWVLYWSFSSSLSVLFRAYCLIS